MKDQYFGDFGDYQKFSLLQCLRDIGNFKILVHWLKTKDDGGKDGRHIAYLKNSTEWGHFDPVIFDFLKKQFAPDKRSLSVFENSKYAVGISFINSLIENLSLRSELLNKIRANNNIDLVFFDPDNGMEVKSMTKKNCHKFVLWQELLETYNAGKSLLVYQHFSRKNRDKFIQEKLAEIKKTLFVDAFPLKVKHSVYFLIPQKKHSKRLTKALGEYVRKWKLNVTTPQKPPWIVYMLRCTDGTLYTGITTDLVARVEKHNTGMGAKYTRSRLPVVCVWQEAAATQSEAKKREAALKQFSKAQKEQMLLKN